MAYLRIEQTEGGTSEFVLDKDEVRIGRGTTNDLHFRNPWLSRLHARIARRQGRYHLADAGSRNGTFLNGEALSGERPLRHGDVVTLGDIRLHFVDPPTGSLKVSDAVLSLDSAGTVVISSDELVFSRYRETPSSAAPGGETAHSLMPALNAAASTLITHYPLGELVEHVMTRICEAVAAERGALLLAEAGGELQIAVRRGFDVADPVQLSRTIIRAVLDNHQAVLMMDARTDERFDKAQSILVQGIRSILCVPLWNNREVIGLIYLDHRGSGRLFTKSDLRLVGLIANMAAIKIENVRLLEDQLEKKRMARELELGAEIQRGLLPATDPEVAHYDVHGANQSCYEVGGDYYDFISKADGKLAMVVADVSGKGVGAALLMAVLQASLRSLVHTAAAPAELVEQLNRVLVESSPVNRFATLFYAELDTQAHTVDYVNAGHNPALLAADGRIRELEATGPLVGVIPDAEFQSRRIAITPDAVLVLYTDGITELTNSEGEEFGTERLVEFLGRSLGLKARDLATALRDRMEEFGAAEGWDDDSTMVVVRRIE